MLIKRLIGYLGSFGMFIMMMEGDVIAQVDSPPFVHKVSMTIIDPANYSKELVNIDGFSHLAKSDNRKVFATFCADSGKNGILVCDGNLLKIESVYWLPRANSGLNFKWLGIESMGKDGMLALCFEEQHGDPNRQVQGFLVRYLPGQPEPWQMREVVFPQSVAVFTYLPKLDVLAGLTNPANCFFLFNLEKNQFQLKSPPFDFVPYDYPSCRLLFNSSEGNLYGSYKGRLFCYHADNGFFEYLGTLPCEYGHLSEVSLTAMASDGKDFLVGGTSGDGYLFALNIQTRELLSLGKPTDGTEIRTLVYAGSAGFWGIASTPGQSCRLFHLDRKQPLLEDIGIPSGILETDDRKWTWRAFDISDMTVLDDGRILLAECSRQAKLLVFNPQEYRR